MESWRLWRCLYFGSGQSGECPVRLPLVLAAAKRAGPPVNVRYLNLDYCSSVSYGDVLTLLRSFPEIRHLCKSSATNEDNWSVSQVEAALALAPHMAQLSCSVSASSGDALRLLRCAPPFAPLRMERLVVEDCEEHEIPALATAIAAHAGLKCIEWNGGLEEASAFDIFVDACIAAKLISVDVMMVPEDPEAHLAALTRLLRENSSLRALKVFCCDTPLVRGDGVQAFCDALRDSRLDWLCLSHCSLWGDDGECVHWGQMVMYALCGHPSLTHLWLSGNPIQADMHNVGHGARSMVGRALAALVQAAGPLAHLYVSNCSLGGFALRPLFAALRHSEDLRVLGCMGNDIDAATARLHVLPAVAYNTSLREVIFYMEGAEAQRATLLAAEVLVARRPPIAH